MAEISVHKYKEMDISNAMVIVSFPTVGLISTIAANFVVSHLKLDLIAAFVSDDFYPAAIIQGGKPTPPVRVYAGDHVCGPSGSCDQIAVITSELPIRSAAFAPLADKIITWCRENGCKLVATVEGVNSEDPLDDKDIEVFHVASNDAAGKMLEGMSSEKMESGMVSGLSGLLLYKGNISGFPVACLLAEAHVEYPDSRSAAAVLRVLDQMVPQIKMDPEPLLKQAEDIEGQVRKAMSRIKPMTPAELPEAPPGMYR